MKIASNIILIIGLIFISFGVFGLYRFKNFFTRILIASHIDTLGFIVLMIGVLVRTGISWFSAKVILIIAVSMLINPIITHSIARSAYYSGYRIEKESKND